MNDLLIRNASVLDGTGADAYFADIAIKDGKIVGIGRELGEAERVIDAVGLTVSPGWIDSHSHSDNAIFAYPDQTEKVEQGITFSITGQCGSSSAPVRREDGSVESVDEFLTRAEGIAQGSGAKLLIGHGTLRRAVMQNENRAPTEKELEEMKRLLRDGLRAGALGLSFGLIYVPGCYASFDELCALARVVADEHGVITAHMRSEGDMLIDAVQEMIDIHRASGCRTIISHHKAAGGRANWGKVKTTLAMIDRANEEGGDMYFDVYPYCASHTSLRATFLPKKFHPEGLTNELSLLDDQEICKEIKVWANARWHNEFEWVLVVYCKNHPEYEGVTLQKIADLRGQSDDRMQAAFDILRESGGACNACYFTIGEDDVEYVLAHPRAMICTDASVARGQSIYHPRLRGTFPRALGHYVRERSVTSLPEMIRKMTSLPASVYGLQGKGRIEIGADADLCIFDSEEIADQADYQHCTRKNKGLYYVIIDGEVVLEDNVYLGKRCAKIYR